MSRKLLIDYLSLIQTLQKDKIILENTISTIDYNLHNIDESVHTISKPEREEQSIIINIFGHFFAFLIPVLIAVYIIMLIVYAVTRERIALIPIFVNENPFINLAISSVIISFALSCVISPIVSARAKKLNIKSENQYNTAILEEQNRASSMRTTKKRLELNKKEFTQMLSKTSTSLNRLYDLKIDGQNVLYPKYRDIVAVSMFLEYLESNRCNSLEGHEGAYNIFENEKLLNAIVTKLDIIIQSLEDIKQSQHCLYQALCDIRDTENALYAEMQSVSSNVETIAINSQISAASLQSIAFIESCRTLKHGI